MIDNTKIRETRCKHQFLVGCSSSFLDTQHDELQVMRFLSPLLHKKKNKKRIYNIHNAPETNSSNADIKTNGELRHGTHCLVLRAWP